MADQPKSSSAKGVFVFLLFFLPIAGGLAASPFYLNLVSTPERQLDAALMADVESLRRAVLNADQHLNLIRDLRSGEDKPDESVYATKDLLKEYMPSLSATGNMLRNVAEADSKQRGLKSNIVNKIQIGAPSAKTAYADIQSKYGTAHEKMLKDAETLAGRLASVERAGKRGSSHLWANRAGALVQFAKAQILRNRGEFEAWRAGSMRSNAQALVPVLTEMKRLAASVEAQKPVAAREADSKSMDENTAEATELDGRIKQLSSEIAAKESRASQLESAASQARQRISDLLASKQSPASYESEVASLSLEARKAEADWSALQNGTLEGGNMVPSDSPDPVVPRYQGGKAVRGLRDLKAELEGLKEQAALLATEQQNLTASHAAHGKALEKFDSQKGDVDKEIEGLTQSINGILAEADKHDDAARKAFDEALKAFASASKLAKAAISDAGKRVNDAKTAMGSAPVGKDDRLQRVTNDLDMEASLQCLAAEIALQSASIQASRIEMLQQEVMAKNLLAGAIGGEKSAVANDEVEKLRADGASQIAESLKAYEKAAGLIGKASTKFSDATVSGKNYLWQVQVAQAAANLLQATLLADKPEESTAARDKAYKLLADAAKGREQSPLLSPALDTLIYLQKTAH